MDVTPDRQDAPRWQRWLLPSDLVGPPGVERSARDWVMDDVLLLLASALGLAVLADAWSEHSDTMRVLDIALGTSSLLALWFRRHHPGLVGFWVAACSGVSGLAGGAAVVAIFNATVRSSPRFLQAFLPFALAMAAIYAALYRGDRGYDWTGLLVGVLITLIAFVWGLFTRARRELVHNMRVRTEEAEAEQRRRMEEARGAERRRIAGEMHDVLAHRISLLSLHAGALEFRPDATPEEIAEAAGVIRTSAHQAREELRQVVGVLRDEPRGDGAPEPPQPTLSDIPALIEESLAAGMTVRSQIDIPADAAPTASLGRTAYRIVQEGLTNARKHAPGAAVEVGLVRDGGALVVTVISRRAVGVRDGPGAPLPGAGTGLIGLAERVALAGGRLDHGPDPGAGGDFVLRARLPWPA